MILMLWRIQVGYVSTIQAIAAFTFKYVEHVEYLKSYVLFKAMLAIVSGEWLLQLGFMLR